MARVAISRTDESWNKWLYCVHENDATPAHVNSPSGPDEEGTHPLSLRGPIPREIPPDPAESAAISFEVNEFHDAPFPRVEVSAVPVRLLTKSKPLMPRWANSHWRSILDSVRGFGGCQLGPWLCERRASIPDNPSTIDTAPRR